MKIFSNFRPEDDSTYDGIKEICKGKPITFFYDFIPQSLAQLQINPYNFIMLHEPNEFFGMQKWVLDNHNLFSGILTYDQSILDNCPNAILFHHCAAEGRPSDKLLDDFNQKYNKTFEVSFLSGAKSLVEGHKLRQEIYANGGDIKIPKKWFHTLPDFNKEDFDKGGIGRPSDIWEGKKICFQGSMFHVAIENVNKLNWYTEKIADCFATKTLPIYWGCPNIGELGYDEKGIIRFTNKDELINIINSLTPEVYFEKRQHIEQNYQLVKLDRLEDKLVSFFNEIIKINNI